MIRLKLALASAPLGLAFMAPNVQANTIGLSGFNADIIAEKSASNPQSGTSTAACCGWVFYENGAPNTSQGLSANGLVTSSQSAHHQFQLASYSSSNALLVTPGHSATLSLTTPERLSNIYILESSQGGNGNTWNLRLNFSDSTTYTFGSVYDPDWTRSSSDTAASTVGLVHRTSTWASSNPYTSTLSLFEHDFIVPVAYQSKSLVSLTFANITGSGPMMFFAASDSNTAPVPEPATLPLLSMGLLGCLAMRRRGRQA